MTPRLKNVFLRNKKLLLWLLAAVVVVIFFLGSSFLSLGHNKLEMNRLEQQNAALDKEYEQLLVLQKNLEEKEPSLVEEIARTQYGMLKPGEIEFRFNPN